MLILKDFYLLSLPQRQGAIKEEHKSYYAISTAHVYGQEKYLLVNSYLAYRNLHFRVFFSVCLIIVILYTFLWKSIPQITCSYIMHLSHIKIWEIWPLFIMIVSRKKMLNLWNFVLCLFVFPSAPWNLSRFWFPVWDWAFMWHCVSDLWCQQPLFFWVLCTNLQGLLLHFYLTFFALRKSKANTVSNY